MKHFTKDEWQLFTRHEIDDQKRVEMEKHFTGCDSCLENYLSTIEPTNSPPIPVNANFTGRVLEQIRALSVANQRTKKKITVKKNSNIIIYYTAAACITLLFVGSGFFNLFTSSIPQATAHILDTTRQTEKFLANGWLERLLTMEMDIKVEQSLFDWGVNNEEKE